MKRFHFNYLIVTLILSVLVFIVSLIFYPEWSLNVRALIVLAAVVIYGSVEFIANLRTVLAPKEDYSSLTKKSGFLLVQKEPRQIPPTPDDFTGHEDQLKEALIAIQKGSRIIGIFGMGGIGKSVLAQKIGEILANEYSSGQIYLDIGGNQNEALSEWDIVTHVVRSLNPETKMPENYQELQGNYHSILYGKKALILLDNLDSAEQLKNIIPPRENILIITSRERLSLYGMHSIIINTFDEDEAVKFVLRVSPRIREQALNLSRACGFLPLALRYASTFLEEHQDIEVDEYIQSLNDFRREFEVIESSLNISYQNLNDEQKELWRKLAIFPGTFDSEAASTIWEVQISHAKRELSEFVKYSILDWDREANRYKMHNLAKRFAWNQMIWFEILNSGFQFATYYSKLLQRAEILFLKGAEASKEGLQLLDIEWHNIKAAQAWCTKYSEVNERAAYLCSRFTFLGPYILLFRQIAAESLRWHENGLIASRITSDKFAEAANLDAIGGCYLIMEDAKNAINYHRQALSIAREINNREGIGDSLDNLGTAFSFSGKPYRASVLHKAALDIANESGDRFREGRRLTNLARDCLNLRKFPNSISLFQESLKIKNETGDIGGLVNVHMGLSQAFLHAKRYRLAIWHYVISFKLAEKYNDPNILKLAQLAKQSLVFRILFLLLSMRIIRVKIS